MNIDPDFPSHVVSMVLASMTEEDTAKYLTETFRGPGVVCVNWPLTTDEQTACALGHASRILWRTKKLPDHPASRVIGECIHGAMNELLTGTQRSNTLVHDLAATWYRLKHAIDSQATDRTSSLGSSLPSVPEDLVFHNSI
jgi:hypothetical protein